MGVGRRHNKRKIKWKGIIFRNLSKGKGKAEAILEKTMTNNFSKKKNRHFSTYLRSQNNSRLDNQNYVYT